MTTSSLDPEQVAEGLGIARGGMTIPTTPHELGLARDASFNACYLEGGAVREEGPPEHMLKEPESERTRGFLKRVVEAGRL